MQGQKDRKRMESTVNQNCYNSTQGKLNVSEANRMVILYI